MVVVGCGARSAHHIVHLGGCDAALSRTVADSALLGGALLVDRVGGRAAALVGALDSRQQFGIHRLDRGTIDGLNRPLDLAFIDLLEHI